ncbi:sigma-70 family RNA polymerase sigma factor [Aneurinibacillus aneurinilyticus]|uniref:sigma-70 family RNA polymerase sigma factor n=1 Tax=Aneurinibacillus aneurinilyticus TaxID=1391 RepID=UPI002E2369DF|nr:sigma-70 family RNA polymerase sigma factor [Aneurinibacillus aneurinilyticus]
MLETTQVNMEIHYNKKDDVYDQIISKEEFSQIYEMYNKRVYKYICFRINNHYAAEDICSHVFETVITKYHSFSPEKSKFEIWLFAIVRNAVTDYFRAQKKRAFFSLNTLLNMVFIESSPEDLVIRDDNNQELFKALARLRNKERNILAMKYGAGLKNSEIAQLMGVSESNIGVVVYRSLRKLHKILVAGGFKNE